jgi:hypothetical protein
MIPVVFIHFGDKPSFIDAVLGQARACGNQVTFLNLPFEVVCQHPFARVYHHMSTNQLYFELACMVRWFSLLDWLKANHAVECIFCDTDVLLFANVDHEVDSDLYYRKHALTLSLGTSGHTSYWRTDALKLFCHWLSKTYGSQNADFKYLMRIYREMTEQRLSGGVSDMLLLKMFANSREMEEMGTVVGEMSVPRSGKVWDHNINSSDPYVLPNSVKVWDGFATEPVDGGKRKRIDFKNSHPYAMDAAHTGETRFLSLHMQGSAKRWINELIRHANACDTCSK